VTVVGMSVVVKSTDRDAAVRRYKALLESGVLQEFELPGGALTVTVLPGLSILSGDEESLMNARPLLASVFVDSLEATEELLTANGWTIGGSLGSPGSVLARDPDGSLFEFVEQTHGDEAPKDAA
jgi:hypothetical protein